MSRRLSVGAVAEVAFLLALHYRLFSSAPDPFLRSTNPSSTGLTHEGSLRLSVAMYTTNLDQALLKRSITERRPTFQMEEHVRLIVLEHLSNKLNIHILDVDFLQTLVHHDDRLVEFLLLVGIV